MLKMSKKIAKKPQTTGLGRNFDPSLFRGLTDVPSVSSNAVLLGDPENSKEEDQQQLPLVRRSTGNNLPSVFDRLQASNAANEEELLKTPSKITVKNKREFSVTSNVFLLLILMSSGIGSSTAGIISGGA